MESADPARAIRYAQVNGEIAAITAACADQGRLSAPREIANLGHVRLTYRRQLIRSYCGHSVQHRTAAAVVVRAIHAVPLMEVVVARTKNVVGAC
jgi:methionine aminopeptidase